ncbi:hypothetical protein EVAR_68918_1 [Eumeta japonica]|uniref:Uncharacterized protein n=1 Tax=Eumeta variegata TaxID=151549 RepID=A0A4C1ZH90_EUMVA|nr:hypothetical protein EVAR_68918_1 [Eumeta japonica]
MERDEVTGSNFDAVGRWLKSAVVAEKSNYADTRVPPTAPHATAYRPRERPAEDCTYVCAALGHPHVYRSASLRQG